MPLSLDGHALDRAVDACFEAALDPEQWTRVLGAMAEAAACTGAIVLLHGGEEQAVIVSDGCAAAMEAYLASDWPANNPRFIRPPSPGTTSDADFMDDEGLARRHAIFRDDLLRKFDMGWFAGSPLFRHDRRQVLISVERDFRREPFQPDELVRLDAAFRVLRRVMSFVPAMDARLRQALLEGFEGRGQAAAIVARDKTVLHLNGAAERIVPRVLRQRQGRLHASEARDEAAWTALVERLVAVAPGAERGGDPILLTSADGGKVLARGMPLPRSASLLFPLAAAVIVFDDLAPAAPRAEVLQAAYGLTPAEARVASALALHCDLGRAARAIGIAHETARSHLKAVFAKTGSASQVECVAKLARML